MTGSKKQGMKQAPASGSPSKNVGWTLKQTPTSRNEIRQSDKSSAKVVSINTRHGYVVLHCTTPRGQVQQYTVPSIVFANNFPDQAFPDNDTNPASFLQTRRQTQTKYRPPAVT